MRLQNQVALLALVLLAVAADARRVRVSRVRTSEEELGDQDGDQQQVQYYAAQAQDDRAPDTRSGRVLLLPAGDALNALYAGRSVTRAQAEDASPAPPVYRASPRALTAAPLPPRQGKEHTKAPPVQTIRNYSKVNDDGSFTFGYEAADGSFKEETRGTDCVVRGKYGYVDPDGNKREFTYVSGNPCDPNAVNQEEEQDRVGASKDDDVASGEENVPANFPTRATLRQLRPAKPTTTLFQQSYSRDSEEEIDEEDLPQVPLRARVRPTPTPSPARPRLIVTTQRPTTALYQTTATQSATTAQPAVRITPRPYSATSTTAEPPATTYRPQALQQVTVTPRPTPLYSKPLSPIRSSTPGTIDFSEELRKFQLDNNVVVTTERSEQRPKSSDPIYSTELVFDPASGQYNTVVYQSLPKQQEVSPIEQRHRLQPYVSPQLLPLQPQHHPHPHQQQQPQPGLYQQAQAQLVQQQQATLLQQSQQLFAQQQRQLQAQQQQQQHRSLAAATYQAPRYQPPQPQLQQVSSTASPVKLAPAPQRYISQPVQYAAGPSPQTQFYYVSPQDAGDQRAALAAGQIDAFLRGHNLSF